MIVFSVSAIALIIFSLVVLLRPLLSSSKSEEAEREAINVQFARQRLSELREQLSSSQISQAEFDDLKQEIESGLVSDLDLDDNASDSMPSEPKSKTSNLIIIATLCALVPIASLGLYLVSGQPSSLSAKTTEQTTTRENAQSTQASVPVDPEIEAMVAGLENKMRESPNDAQGWRLLASSYHQMGRFEKAQAAYQHLLTLDPDNADTLAAIGEVTALASGGMLTGTALDYVNKALELNPNQPQALWLSGLAFAQQNNNLAAVRQWEKLLPFMADSPQQQEQLKDIIAEANRRAGASISESEQVGDSVAELSIILSLSPAISAQVDPDDVVFVIAKAIDGPPAPLAVKRLIARELPTKIRLTDKDAMMEQLSLSRFERVEIKARVSKSGQPIAASGDFESQTVQTSNNNSEPIELLINQAVEL